MRPQNLVFALFISLLTGCMDRLVAEEVRDQSAAALMAANDPLARELVGILGKLHAARPRANDKKTIKDENGTYTDDTEDTLIDEFQTLAAMESGVETPDSIGDSPEGLPPNRKIEKKSLAPASLPPPGQRRFRN